VAGAGTLSDTGKRAVLLLNRTGSSTPMTIRWADLRPRPALGLRIRIRIRAQHLVAHRRRLLRHQLHHHRPGEHRGAANFSGTEASSSTYEDTTTATTPTFTGVTAGAADTKPVDITYANGGSSARKATIQVNSQ
jgi:hypothetical protein